MKINGPITVDCPECSQPCEFCSSTRRQVREFGCGAKMRGCAKAKDKGPCETCGGSGQVAKTIILGPLPDDVLEYLKRAEASTVKPGDPLLKRKVGGVRQRSTRNTEDPYA